MLNFYSNNIRFVFKTGDILLLNFSFIISFFLIEHNGFNNILVNYLILLLYFNVSWIILYTLIGSYEIYRVSSTTKLLSKIIIQLFLHFIFVEALLGLLGSIYNSQSFILTIYGFLILLLPAFHLISIKVISDYRKINDNFRKVVIVGDGKDSLRLANFFEEHPEFGYSLKAHYGVTPKLDLDGLKDQILEKEIDEIYCSMSQLKESELRSLISFANKFLLKIKLLPGYKGFDKNKYKLDYYGNISILIPKVHVLDEFKYGFSKRVFDVAFSAFVIVFFLSWILPLLAVVIKFDSKGPIFFKQRRSGFKNRDFYCWKLRTMYTGEANNVFRQATRSDSRITKIGSILRKTSLDELPQFFNVLKGDMSLIGPRPHPVEMTTQYGDIVDDYKLRLSVKPGISGMSQVLGFRGETREINQMRNRVKMDIFYIEKWSIWLDFKIVYWTIKAIFKGQNEAY